jgi:nitrous oxidase accessory protein NosD
VPETGEIVARGNEINRSTYQGIVGAGTKDSGLLRIEDNRIRDCRGDGLSYENDHPALVPMLLAKGNEIESCIGNGIFVDAYQAELLDNRISKCKRDGIFTEGSAIRIANNDVKSNGLEGIHVLYHAEVIGNVIQKNLGSGIDLSDGSQGIVVRDNVVTGNGHEGIDNDSKNVDIDHNVVTKNGRGVGPDVAGAGHGNGTVASFLGNHFGSGGPTTQQRLEFDH